MNEIVLESGQSDNPSGSETRITVRIPMELREELERTAKAREHGLSEEIRCRLTDRRNLRLESSDRFLEILDELAEAWGLKQREEVVQIAVFHLYMDTWGDS